MKNFVLTFHTHFEALSAFKKAKTEKNIGQTKLIAIPRKISSSCGTALSFTADSKEVFSNLSYAEAFECIGDAEFIKVN